MAYKIVQNVIFDGVAYEKGNVIDLGFIDSEVVTSLVERGIIAESNDEVTVVHGDANAPDTVASPVETPVAPEEPETPPAPETPVVDPNAPQTPAPAPQAPAEPVTLSQPLAPGQQPTAQQIDNDLNLV